MEDAVLLRNLPCKQRSLKWAGSPGKSADWWPIGICVIARHAVPDADETAFVLLWRLQQVVESYP